MDQQEICINCGWCCQHDVFKVQTEAQLELYWIRGHDIIYDPKTDGWFIIMEQTCQFFRGVCIRYDCRPVIDQEWLCPYPDGSIWEKLDILRQAAKQILTRKFGDPYDTATC